MQQSMLNSHSQLTLHSSSCPLLSRDVLAQSLGCQSSSRNTQMQSTRYSEAHGSQKSCFTAKTRLQGRSRQCRVAAQSSLRTPHSGYHFDGSDRRFFEGWYFKVSLEEPGEAFALIYSIEDPLGGSTASAAAAQIMGPDDSYLVQYSRDVKQFWASESSLELGANFEQGGRNPGGNLHPEDFDRTVRNGYQASPTWHQGSIVANEEGCSGNLPSAVKSAKWAFSVQPRLGWGDSDSKQKATAGWLASLPVFEPHWQVLMALGSASGWIEWDGKMYKFENAPAYAEKNWGGGFPKKWFWIQCDQFQQPSDKKVALTIAGAIRGVLNLPIEEEVGMVGLHWGEKFIAFVPWEGEVDWEVEPWGSWKVGGENPDYKVQVIATCQQPGTPLRAPTQSSGFSPQCKDSFFGKVEIKLWEKRTNELVLHATSNTAAVEVGGGPWWSTWKSKAEMREPLRSLLKLPVDVQSLSSRLPAGLRPKGL